MRLRSSDQWQQLSWGTVARQGRARRVKGKAKETTAVAIKNDSRRTKRERREHVEHESQDGAAHGRSMTIIDPWSMLLEQLMDMPGEEPTARARPNAGSTIKPTRPKKRREGNEQ